MDEAPSRRAHHAAAVNQGAERREIDLGPFTVLIDAPRDPDALTRLGVERADPSPGYWAHLWPSSVELARYLASSDLIAPGVRLLEVGCGLGLCGITAARRGAAVTITDFNPQAVAWVARNAELNRVTARCEPFDWNTPPPEHWPGAFDLLIASDVLYEPASFAGIARLVLALNCAALIADPARPQSGDAEARFADLGLRAWATPAPTGRIMLMSPA